LSKIVSDPSIHGFFDFSGQRFLRKMSAASNGSIVGAKTNLMRKATLAEPGGSTGQPTNPDSMQNLNLEGILPADFLMTHNISPKIYRIEIGGDPGNNHGEGDASVAFSRTQGSQAINISTKFGHQNQPGEDLHQKQAVETHQSLRVSNPGTPREPALGIHMRGEGAASTKDSNAERMPADEIMPKTDSAALN